MDEVNCGPFHFAERFASKAPAVGYVRNRRRGWTLEYRADERQDGEGKADLDEGFEPPPDDPAGELEDRFKNPEEDA